MTPRILRTPELVHEYVRSFYLGVFSDTPKMHRLLHEMIHNHAYFKVLARDLGLKKWLGALELLTNLTANSKCMLDQYFIPDNWTNC